MYICESECIRNEKKKKTKIKNQLTKEQCVDNKPYRGIESEINSLLSKFNRAAACKKHLMTRMVHKSMLISKPNYLTFPRQHIW